MSAEPALRGLSLRAQGIIAGYGGDPVIRGITVDVAPGQVVSLVGPNGSGKSTLLEALLGLRRARVDNGRILGVPCARFMRDAAQRRRLGAQLQRVEYNDDVRADEIVGGQPDGPAEPCGLRHDLVEGVDRCRAADARDRLHRLALLEQFHAKRN